MRQIFPGPETLGDEVDLVALAGPDGRLTPGRDVSPAVAALVGAIAALYAYPEEDRPWVRANMVASADGAAGFNDRSGGLSGPADRFVFSVLRSLADVIVVGASTARAERYGKVRQQEIWPQLRAGRPPLPPIAVLTRRLDLEIGGRLLTGWPKADTQPTEQAQPEPATTIVLTTTDATAARRSAAQQVADVVVAGEHEVTGRAAVEALARHRHRRILVEGGPAILGQFTREGVLDELCLTISPVLEAGESSRIATAGSAVTRATTPTDLALASLIEDRGFLLARYLATLDTRRVPIPALT